MLFNEPLFINRLIQAYLKRSENREYLHLLFGKIMDGLYSTQTKAGKRPEERKSVRAESSSPTKESELTFPAMTYSDKSGSVMLRAEEKKGSESDKISWEQTSAICDSILKSITKKLIYMPLSVRFLCKLVEKIALANVFSVFANHY